MTDLGQRLSKRRRWGGVTAGKAIDCKRKRPTPLLKDQPFFFSFAALSHFFILTCHKHGRPDGAEVENEVKQPHWKHRHRVLLQPPSIFVLLHFLFFPSRQLSCTAPWDQLISYASLLGGGALSSYLKSFPARQHGILEIACSQKGQEVRQEVAKRDKANA